MTINYNYDAQQSLTDVTTVLSELKAALTKNNNSEPAAAEVRNAIFLLKQVEEYLSEEVFCKRVNSLGKRATDAFQQARQRGERLSRTQQIEILQSLESAS